MPCLLLYWPDLPPALGHHLLDRPSDHVDRRLWRKLALAAAGSHFPAVHNLDVRDPGAPGNGLTGWDWMWVIVAVLCDVMHTRLQPIKTRDRIPSKSTAPAVTPPM